MKKISFDPIQNFFLLVLHYPFSELAVLQQPAPAGWQHGLLGKGRQRRRERALLFFPSLYALLQMLQHFGAFVEYWSFDFPYETDFTDSLGGSW